MTGAVRRRARKSNSPTARRSSANHVAVNLRLWERQSARYDKRHAHVLGGARAMAWGLWRIPESGLGALGDVRGRDVLELGCGAARWSLALARQGARVVGIDLSPTQLSHAVRLQHRSARRVALVRGDAERLPFEGQVFDLVFCDWGAMTFADPFRTVPEVARVLRNSGRLVFVTSTPLRAIVEDRRTNRIDRRLRYDYFGLHRLEYPDEVNFQLPYGEWIRLFASNGLQVESLLETRPPRRATTTYLNAQASAWAARWPVEAIWQARKSTA
jgi:SAM-dependent methyltransferase